MINDKGFYFITTEDYTKEDIKKVQDELLRMAKIICDILESNNIPYMIGFGTLLGAVRHQGFIPWDDDFDLFLFDDDENNYDKTIKLLERELPSYLLVHNSKNDPLYFKSWSMIKNINTAVVQEPLYHIDNQLLQYNCIAIDLFRMKRINKDSQKSYQLNEALAFFKKKKKLGLIKERKYLEEVNEIKVELSKLKVMDKKNKDHYFFLSGMKKPISYENTFPLRKYKISNFYYYGPKNSDLYLKNTYENYNILPSYEKRKSHYKKVVFFK